MGITNLYIHRYGNLGRRINGHPELSVFSVTHEDLNEIEGELQVLEIEPSVIAYKFEQPFNRRHDVNLKQGISFNPLEEVNDDFIAKTDKGAFGGIRYTTIIERVLRKRKGDHVEYSKGYSRDKEDEYRQSNKNHERSREKKGHQI